MNHWSTPIADDAQWHHRRRRPATGTRALLLAAGLLAVPCVIGTGGGIARAVNGTITDCSDQSLRAAVAAGGVVEYAVTCNPVWLAGELVVPSGVDVTVRAPLGTTVVLDAHNSSRHFRIEGGSLTLVGLSLVNGLVTGVAGANGVSGQPGSAGAFAEIEPKDSDCPPVYRPQLYAGPTIHGGRGVDGANAPSVDEAKGGSVLVSSGSLTLDRSQISASRVVGGNGGAGGRGGNGGPAGTMVFVDTGDCPLDKLPPAIGGDGGNGGHGGRGANGGAAHGGAIYSEGSVALRNGSTVSGLATGGIGGRAGRGGDGERGDDGGPGWTGPSNSGAAGGQGGPGGDGGSGGDEGDAGRGGAAEGGAIFSTGTLTLESSVPPVQVTGVATGGRGLDETAVAFLGENDFGGGDAAYGGAGGSGGNGASSPGAPAGAGGPGGPGGRGGPGGSNAGEAGGGPANGGAIFSTGALAINGNPIATASAARVTGTARGGEPGRQEVNSSFPTHGEGGFGGIGGDGGWGPHGMASSDEAGGGGDAGAAGDSGTDGAGGPGRTGTSGGDARGGAIYDSGTFSATGTFLTGLLEAGAAGDGGVAGSPRGIPAFWRTWANPGQAGNGTQGPRRTDSGDGKTGGTAGRGGDGGIGRSGARGGRGGDGGDGGAVEGGVWYHAGSAAGLCTECTLTADVVAGYAGLARFGGNGSAAGPSAASGGGDGGWGGGALGSPDAPGKNGGNGAPGGDGGTAGSPGTPGPGGNGGDGGDGGSAAGGGIYGAAPVIFIGGEISGVSLVARPASDGAIGASGGKGGENLDGGWGGDGGAGGQADGGGGNFGYAGGFGGNGASGGSGSSGGNGTPGANGGTGGSGGRGGDVLGGAIYAAAELHVYGGARILGTSRFAGLGGDGGFGGPGGDGGGGTDGGGRGVGGAGGFGSAGAPLGEAGDPGQPADGSNGARAGDGGHGGAGGRGGSQIGGGVYAAAASSSVDGVFFGAAGSLNGEPGGWGGSGGPGAAGGDPGEGGSGGGGGGQPGGNGNGGNGDDGGGGGGALGGSLYTAATLVTFASNTMFPVGLIPGSGGGAGNGGPTFSGGWFPGSTGFAGVPGTAGTANYPLHNAIVTPNNPPVISDIAPLTVPLTTTSGYSNPIPFTLGDIEDGANDLVPVAASPWSSSVVFGGSGTNRTISVWIPSFTAMSATITISVTDSAGAPTSRPFPFTIFETRHQPTITVTAPATRYYGYEVPFATAQLTGAISPFGDVRFDVFDAADSTCSVRLFRDWVSLNSSGQATLFHEFPPGTYTWVAFYDPYQDPNNAPAASACGAPGSVTTVTVPTVVANLIVAPVCTPAQGAPGAAVACTTSVTNNGPHAASPFSLTVDLPSGSTITQTPSGGGFACTTGAASPEISCFKDFQAAGTTSAITFTSTVSAGAVGGTTLVTTHHVEPAVGDYDPYLPSNTATSTFFVRGTSTTVTAPASAALGQPISATAALVGATPTASGTITFRLYPPGSVCAGAAVFSSSATVAGPGTYASGSFIPTTAGTYSWQAEYFGNLPNNPPSISACGAAGSQTVVQSQVDLSLTKTCSPTLGAAGTTVKCTLAVKNLSATAAPAVVLNDDVAPGAVVTVAPTGGSFTCTTAATSPRIRCTKPTQPTGSKASSVTYSYTLPVSAVPGASFVTTATVSAGSSDPNLANNSASSTVSTSACTVDRRGDGAGATVVGTKNTDIVCGSAFADNIDGAAGADQLFGFDGADTLIGGNGNDFINGGNGQDSINGGGNNDTIYAIDGQADTLTCGAGTDVVYRDPGLDTVAGDCETLR